MAHPVKCKICGQQFDRDKEECVEMGGRRWAHKNCAENIDMLPKKEKPKNEQIIFTDALKDIFGNSADYPSAIKLAKKYMEEFGFTFSGMAKTLRYFYQVQNNPIDKSKGTIGIIPYVYEDARKYYYSIFLAQERNKNILISNKTITINTKRPTAPYDRRKERQFDFK